MGKWVQRILDLLLMGSTLEVRFFLCLFSLGMAVDLAFDLHPCHETIVLFQLTPSWAQPNFFWGFPFFLYAMMLFKGLGGRYGIIPLLLEGILGWAIWTLVAVTYFVVESHPGPEVAGALAATWLLVRYPTHWEDRRG